MDNLTACAIAAQRAGMSYGQYMAQRPPRKVVVPTAERPLGEHEFICKGCGKRVIKSKPRQRYCTMECSVATNKAKALERYHQAHKPEVKECPICGKEFEAIWGRKYCSDECAAERRKGVKREKYGHQRDYQTPAAVL